MNLSEDYEILEDIIDENYQISYAQHFRLLPLTIRTYLARKLAKLSYQHIQATKDKYQQFTVCPETIKLFKKAQIVFRKNFDKTNRIINGQAAVIQDILFDVDFKSNEQILQQKKDKDLFISQQLSNNTLRKVDQLTNTKIQFSNEFLTFTKEYLNRIEANNTNSLRNQDILESEKVNLLTAGIEPRIQQIVFQIEGDRQHQSIKNLEKLYINQKISIPSTKVVPIIKSSLNAVHRILKLFENFSNLNQLNASIEELLVNNEEIMEIFGISIVTNTIDRHLLQRSHYHLTQFLKTLPEEIVQVQISQIPLNLGYARTIHTSQGATFENACVTLDEKQAKTPGLLYTALSRVKNLNSLYLQGDFTPQLFDVKVPVEILEFFFDNFVKAEQILNNDYFKKIIITDQIKLDQMLDLIPNDYENIKLNLLNQIKISKKENQQ